MNSSTWLRMLVVLPLLTVGMMVVAGSAPPQATSKNTGKLLQLEGQVSVNGTSAVSGATVFSDSTGVVIQSVHELGIEAGFADKAI